MAIPVKIVEARGLRCPWPALRLAEAAREAMPGAVIELLADDPAAATDIPALCAERGWTLSGVPPRYRIVVP